MSLWNKDNYYIRDLYGTSHAQCRFYLHKTSSIQPRPGIQLTNDLQILFYWQRDTKLKVASVSKQRWKMYLTRLPKAWNPQHLERDIWMFKDQHDDIQSPSKHAATAWRRVA